MRRVCLAFDECKPHWARARGYDRIAEECGLKIDTLTGDFDTKLTYIYGEVVNVEAFKARVNQSPMSDACSVYEVTKEAK